MSNSVLSPASLSNEADGVDEIASSVKKMAVSSNSNSTKENCKKSNQTPSRKNDQPRFSIPKSAPPKLPSEKEKRSDITTTPLHSKTKPREPNTDLSLTKRSSAFKRDVDAIYQDQVKVSKKFLSFEKRKHISKKAHLLLIKFREDYSLKKESKLDITGLSARARIYLLSSVINFKIKFLPPHSCVNNEDFKKYEVETDFWKKTPCSSKSIAEIIDKLPTKFQIGEFFYELEMASTLRQKGSGRIKGLSLDNSAEPYFKIHEVIKKYECEKLLSEYSDALLKQKKDGEPICIYDTKTNKVLKEPSRFLNGFNLLLDYEVARRLVDEDPYQDLPVVTYIYFIITHLNSHFKDFVVGKIPSKWDFPVSKYDHNQFQSLFTGGKRELVAKRMTDAKFIDTQSSAAIRHNLRYLHMSDEDSGDEYSGDEKIDLTSEIGNLSIKE